MKSLPIIARNPRPSSSEIAAHDHAKHAKLMISPVVRVETTLGIARSLKDADGATQISEAHFDKATELVVELIRSLGAREMHLTESMGTAAITALKTYGKVAGHPARLNMGDALAYAAAKAFHATLLYKGDDFAQTDLA